MISELTVLCLATFLRAQDIDGGMQANIYDSMARAVSKAAVVIAFIDQRYQDSDNCKLELNFAKQSKVPIVVVKMAPSPWIASEWLGIITGKSTSWLTDTTVMTGADTLCCSVGSVCVCVQSWIALDSST